MRDLEEYKAQFDEEGDSLKPNPDLKIYSPKYYFMEREVHGVLKCSVCKTTWDRDANASLNMLLKALFIVEGRELPQCWQREAKKEELQQKDENDREQAAAAAVEKPRKKKK